jgi:hypothetical protein
MGRRAAPLLAWLAALPIAAAPAGRAQEGAAPAPAPPPWTLPPADSCQPEGGLRGLPAEADAPPVAFQPGDTFSVKQLETLRRFLPAAVWEVRDRFFYEGMRLEIGACFADYAPPAFFQTATAENAGKARLGPEGELEGHVAGLPFPPEQIDPADPEAALRWAWDFELRYQGAGFWGKFRTADMVGRDGRAEPFVGEIFKVQTAFRADRAEDGYTAPGARGKHWVAGGQLFEPFDARHYSWRQYRDLEHLTQASRSDDVHAYLPDFRRVRRVAAADVEGLYMPSFSVGVVKPTAVATLGGVDGGGAGGGASAGGVSAAASAITTKRSGFEGLEMRPLLYAFRLVGVQDVLTPINAATPAYPSDPDREFGPWGLSFASDRWDLRRAVVIEARAKASRSAEQVSRFVLYLDAQTLAPLYYASWDPRDEQIDVGLHVGRWSEERDDYRPWPRQPERAVRVIDSVGAAYANVLEDGGWRRESWEIVSTPPDDRTVKREISVSNLTKRR